MFELGLLPPLICSKLYERNVPRNCETSKEVAVLLLARGAPAPRICTKTRSLQNGGGGVMWEQVRG